ncbi:xylulokinase [Catenibacillus scindens]|uniref:Xylulokinase n=1 Tax=Catenibacillus scindens TaxID=673271 RepID=A0A7W8H7F5_9FIRM|nr:FGGY-family carbohydrate kinase [Catenibacillus scindens]MBB5263128.1 xylulokinase [Catenibacillus scindens]
MISAQNYLLGMDLGTTNIKAIILDENGNVCASASQANHLIFPGTNMVEQDPEEWWKNAVTILKEVTDKAGKDVVSKIRGICISSQTVTMLPVDKDGNPLRNALIWMDSRSANELAYIIDTLGFDHYVSIIGAQPDVAFLPGKLLWFKQNEPELFAKTEKILQASSYINMKLTGKMTMDIDQAARCQCLDIQTLKWSDEIGNVLGVDLNRILPQPLASNEIIGGVTDEAAALTGLMSGTPVVAGASDAMASMYATGLCQLGEAGESSGTTSLVFVGADRQSASDIPVVTKPCSIPGMPYVFDAPINTSGASIKWYLDTFGQPEKDYAAAHNIGVYDHLNACALEVPAGSHGMYFFPYLLGERAPLWNSHARGMFIGMSLDTTRNDFIRAVFEGTAFALRHVMETIKETGATANALRITGGGSKSRTWCQIKASMLHMPVYTLDEKSGDVPFGDTLIVGNAVGVFPDMKESINKIIQIKDVIQPVEEWEKVYDKMYPLYIEMYQHLDKDLVKLKEMGL